MLIRKFYSAYPPKGRIFIAALVCAFYGINADAKPDMRPLGPNIADRGSAYYHFNVAYFDSLDGERHYKVWTAIPNAAPPAEGYPILYALDGNAVMDRVSDSLLAQLTQKRRPLLWPWAIKRHCPLIRTPEPMTTGRPSRRILPIAGGTRAKAAVARHFASYYRILSWKTLSAG